MVGVSSLEHVMLFVEVHCSLVAADLHGLQLLQLPFVHVDGPAESDVGSDGPMVGRAVVAYENAYGAACPDGVFGFAVKTELV